MYYNLYHWNGYNKQFLIQIHNLIENHFFYQAMEIISLYIGNYVYAPITITILIILVYSIAKFKKEEQKTSYLKIFLKNLIVMGVSFIIMAILIKSFKYYFSLPRPYCSINISLLRKLLIHDYNKCFRSFPSGHTAYASVIVFSIWPVLNYWLKAAGITFLIAVAISRIALAMHYPADVITSILMSLVITVLIHKIINLVEKKYPKLFSDFYSYILGKI